MPTPLKEIYFTPASLAALADTLAAACAEQGVPFDRTRFLAEVYAPGWDDLELKDRMRRTATAMFAVLSADYPQALAILGAALPAVRGFEAMAFQDYVERYGRDDPDRSLHAIGQFTRYASGEFAVRPFLAEDLEGTLAHVRRWAADSDARVRRLASEGCRPRLPWAMALPELKRDPAPILPILAMLKDDPSEDVRRSVANNLNDIAKDHPNLVLRIAQEWHGVSPATDALLKHACRTLLKQGNPQAMALFGFESPHNARALDLRVEPAALGLGGTVTFFWTLDVTGDEPVNVRLEYALEFARPRGGSARKVFRISERVYAPGRYAQQKRHSMQDLSTRKHHPGPHRITLNVNGEPQGTVEFALVAGS